MISLTLRIWEQGFQISCYCVGGGNIIVWGEGGRYHLKNKSNVMAAEPCTCAVPTIRHV